MSLYDTIHSDVEIS